MRTGLTALAGAILIAGATLAMPAEASAQEYEVTCASDNYRYTRCSLRSPGYVTLEQQISSTQCVKGRTWDYDRREIWVDDGCAARFRVHDGNGEHVSGGSAAAAIGVALGAAILGAIVDNNEHKDDHKYQDSNYQGARHSSYVPAWMVGSFQGYNPDYHENMVMTILEDGRMRARLDDGRMISGWVNNQELHIGTHVLDIDRTHDGIATHPLGNSSHNVLRYRRVGGEAPQYGVSTGHVSASGSTACSTGSPSYNRQCQWTIERKGSGAGLTATLRVEVPGIGAWRTFQIRRGEGAGQPVYTVRGAEVETYRDGDMTMVSVNDREFFRFPDAVFFGG